MKREERRAIIRSEEIMNRIYICGSFKFIREMDELKRRLKDENMKCETPSRTDGRGIMGCLKKIDDANVVYIVNPEGYIGKSVSVDIGYAYAKDKPIYAMHSVDDPSVMDLINGVLSPKELIDSLKKGSMSEK